MDKFRHAMSPSCVAHTRKFVVSPTQAGLSCATTSQTIESRSKEEGRLIGNCSTKQGTIVFLSSPDAMGTISSHPNRISLRVSAPLKPRRFAPAAIRMKHTSLFTITRTRSPTIGCSNLPPSNVTSKPIDVGTCKFPWGSRHGSLPRMDPCFLVHLVRPWNDLGASAHFKQDPSSPKHHPPSLRRNKRPCYRGGSLVVRSLSCESTEGSQL